MKKNALALAAAMAVMLHSNAAYEIQSPWLQDPDSIKPFCAEWADFWIPAYDTEYGGFFSEVQLDGGPGNTNQKAGLAQSRNAYGFVRAFMVTGDESYLGYAHGALDFMYAHHWNEANGGWWGLVNRTGDVINPGTWYNNDKWSFWQHYYLLGIGALYEATNDPDDLSWLQTGIEENNTALWDGRPEYLGYYNSASWDGSSQSGKGFTPTVDGITTNALYNYLTLGGDDYKTRLLAMGGNIVDHLTGNMDTNGVTFGFPESFDDDWNINWGSTGVSVGHMIKTAWCLGRIYLVEPDEKYKEAASKILYEVWNYERDDPSKSAWDHVNGGPYTNFDWLSGARKQSTKDWWTTEQGFTGGIVNWYISGDDVFLQMADESIDFFMNHFVDYDYGEVYSATYADGTVADNKKGDMFKAAYHSIELAYYVYLYGNLYCHRQPVELYYLFPAMDAEQEISLWPLAIEDDKLKITGVTLDGGEFTGFDRDTRTLTLAPGEGGKFKVTFEAAEGEPPAVTAQPSSQTVVEGVVVTFAVEASGTEPLAYQWQFGGADIEGATDSELVLAGVQAADGGEYTVIVSNEFGQAASDVAVLTVTPKVLVLWPDAVELGGGWYQPDEFGRFHDAGFPLIWHAEHGWLYVWGNGPDSIFLYDYALGGWLWTKQGTYPFLYYWGGTPGWLWYNKGGAAPDRLFYQYAAPAGWKQEAELAL